MLVDGIVQVFAVLFILGAGIGHSSYTSHIVSVSDQYRGVRFVFGKNIGGDILCNKKTFLLINALRLANKEQAEALRNWMDKKEFDPAQKIQAFTSIYNELQLKQLTENRIQAYYDASVENLNALQVAPEKLTILKEVCDHLMHRQS